MGAKAGTDPARLRPRLCECGCGQPTKIALQTEARRGWVKGQPRRFLPGHHARLLAERYRKEYIGKFVGEKSARWKGSEISYEALHTWVRYSKEKTGKCSTCSHRGVTQWANISGVYLRDLDDFAEMCQSCHKELDNPE